MLNNGRNQSPQPVTSLHTFAALTAKTTPHTDCLEVPRGSDSHNILLPLHTWGQRTPWPSNVLGAPSCAICLLGEARVRGLEISWPQVASSACLHPCWRIQRRPVLSPSCSAHPYSWTCAPTGEARGRVTDIHLAHAQCSSWVLANEVWGWVSSVLTETPIILPKPWLLRPEDTESLLLEQPTSYCILVFVGRIHAPPTEPRSPSAIPSMNQHRVPIELNFKQHWKESTSKEQKE